jgi:hypothetical protein
LVRTSQQTEPVSGIRLQKADEGVRRMPACNASSANEWIGGGLKVNPGHSHFKGPVYGEHDSHGKDGKRWRWLSGQRKFSSFTEAPTRYFAVRSGSVLNSRGQHHERHQPHNPAISPSVEAANAEQDRRTN